MPGRCAAPPAPAMMTLKPAPRGGLAIGPEPVGRAMGRDDARLVATPRSSRMRAAAFIVGQSDWLPMTIPTSTAIRAPGLLKRAL